MPIPRLEVSYGSESRAVHFVRTTYLGEHGSEERHASTTWQTGETLPRLADGRMLESQLVQTEMVLF